MSCRKKYCSDRTPYVIPGEPAIEHIFSELYNVPVKIKRTISRSKVLELLLYLDALELSGHTEERPYFYKGQVEKIKAIQALLTQDLTKNYTLEELSRAKFGYCSDSHEKLLLSRFMAARFSHICGTTE